MATSSVSGTPQTHKWPTFPLVTVVGREGLEPPTPCASFISVQSGYQRFCGNPQVRWPQWFGLVMVVSGWFAVSCAPGAPLRADASPSARGCAEAPRYQMLISAAGGTVLFGGGLLEDHSGSFRIEPLRPGGVLVGSHPFEVRPAGPPKDGSLNHCPPPIDRPNDHA